MLPKERWKMLREKQELLRMRPNCSVTAFDGTMSASQWTNSLWDRFLTAAPA
jgi:hypothetical protein